MYVLKILKSKELTVFQKKTLRKYFHNENAVSYNEFCNNISKTPCMFIQMHMYKHTGK